jgi:hypothetical protein
MSNGISPAATYRHPLVGAGYDLLARLVFAPVGGLDALRAAALDEMGLAPGMHVLELGCGTGALTTVVDVLRDGFAPELADTGLVTARRLSLAAGLAVAMRCRPG